MTSRVSVCVATYNGAPYIEEQLKSILDQIAENDELLVSDDGSRDGTVEVVRRINDPRIKIVVNERNLGHVRNFEQLIALAEGDIIFLSDQDDRWGPGKVERGLEILDMFPEVAMVHHGYRVIDSGGHMSDERTCWRGGVRRGWCYLLCEFVRPTVFGSCLALRGRVKEYLLPFPRAVYAHDHWATIVGALAGGIFYIDEYLTLRRVHGGNLTPKRGLDSWSKIRVRALFLLMVASAVRRKSAAARIATTLIG